MTEWKGMGKERVTGVQIDYKEANLDVKPVVLPHCTAKVDVHLTSALAVT